MLLDERDSFARVGETLIENLMEGHELVASTDIDVPA